MVRFATSEWVYLKTAVDRKRPQSTSVDPKEHRSRPQENYRATAGDDRRPQEIALTTAVDPMRTHGDLITIMCEL